MATSDERRRHIRLVTPLNVTYAVAGNDKIVKVVSKDISAVGVRFETKEKIDKGSIVELTLELPKASNPVHARGKLVWLKRVSLEDGSPYEAGVEFIKIEEDNKNTFLKYLCDTIYNQTEK